MSVSTATYEEVIQLVKQWSPAQRFSLVQTIFQSLAPEIKPPVKQKKYNIESTWVVGNLFTRSH